VPAILHVLEAVAGGTERHLLDLIREVRECEHVVVAPRAHLGESSAAAADRAREAGARVEIIDMRRAAAPVANARALISLRAMVRQIRPDVIHGHSSIGGAFARLAAVGSQRPVVYTPHGVKRTRWALAAERALARRTDRLIAVSESEASFALRRGLTDERRLVVIPNGVELELPPPLRPTLRSRLGIPDDAMLIGSLGRLTWQKAPEVYVAACAEVAAELPGTHFVLIGTGPEEQRVSTEIAAADLSDRFHRLPSLPCAAAAFGELDLFVLTSRFEGGPYSVLEAMRAGVPVVATAADGTRDAVVPGVTGRLVPIDDHRAVAAAAIGLLRDRAVRAELGAAARERVAERFDVRAMAAATAVVYGELVASPPA
jgi:glycosyltransferase involved in cell wall biosynthesis